MKRVLTLLLLLCCFGWLSAQTYKIGDVYIAPDGSLGIVYYIHPDGSGGWVVALDDASTGCAWGATTDVPGLVDQNTYFEQQLLNDTAGYANTQTIRDFQNDTSYAAGKVDFANGWVLPSPAQLSMLYGQLPFIASAITGAGGTTLAYDWYWCSAEVNSSRAWRIRITFGGDNISGSFNVGAKTNSCRVRAVRSFSYTTAVYDSTLTYQWNTGSTQPYINVSPSQTTAYTVTATTGFGCSNTSEQTIVVSDGSPQTIYDTVCQGAGYEANGFTLTAAETATPGILSLSRTLTTAGCSFTLTLQLTVTPTVASTCSATACDSYIWNGVTYYESGDFPQTFTTANGCDSVVTLHLTINSKTYGDTTVVACEHFTWHGAGYTTTPAVAPTYTIPGGNHYGCDSIVTLHLTINHKTYGDTVVSACEHFTWHGAEYTTTPVLAPTYTIPRGNHNGCDSTVTLHLTIHKDTTFRFSETACDSYSWNGQTYTQSGDYVQHFQTVYGCDSAVTLHLTIHNATTFQFSETACDSFTWNGQTYTQSGDYVQHFQTVHDCDSAVTLHLTINNTATHQFFETACDSYTWNGQTYTQSGDYVQHFQTIHDCDSTVTLHLTIHNATTFQFSETACDSYTWNGQTYTTSGDYVQHFQTVYGCDSAVTLHLTVHNATTFQFSETACDSYTWNGQTYTQSGDYVQHFQTVHDCDSAVTLHLTIHNAVTYQFAETACDSFTWNGQTYTTSGDYVQHFQTIHGCDSAVTLHLTINNTVTNQFSETACDIYTWNGQTYTQSGDYVQHFQTIHGCDSAVTLHLTIHNATTYQFSETACDSFTWNGQTYTTSGDYVQHFQTIHGCDSAVTLHLTINNTVTNQFSETACDIYTWNGQIYTTSGEYVQHFQTIHGCDSAVTLHLTMHNAVTHQFSETACDSYAWNGQTYTQSGDYVQHFQTVHGCDSAVTLHLTINNAVTYQFAETACDSYTWNGQTYTSSGDYVQHFQTVHGCDSTVTLHLTIHNATTYQFSEAVCDSYTWNGQTYTSSGDYVQHFQTVHGCDSAVTLHLTMHNAVTNQFAETACDNYTWNGQIYTTSGEYVQHFQTIHGCDSAVTLHLTIHNAVTNQFSETACDSYTWNGQTYTTSGDYVQYFQTVYGCDSTVTVHLTISDFSATEYAVTTCDSLVWNSQIYHQSGDYVQYFQTIHGCDSAVTLHLTVHNAVTHQFSETACDSYTWNGQTYIQSGDYVQHFQTVHGCDSAVTLHLTINNAVTHQFAETACDSYTWNGQTYIQSGDYPQTFTAANGCDSVVTLHLTINSKTYGDTTVVACDHFVWHGVEYTTTPAVAPTYIIPGGNRNGCDSIVTLHLTINHKTYGDIFVSACEHYTWHGVEFTTTPAVAPTYTISGGNHNGCDSTVTLHLTIHNAVAHQFSETTCDTFTWNGQTYTTSGDYVQHFQTVHGCDSTVTLHLTIHNAVAHQFSETACDSYTWNGQTFTQSGDYVQHFQTIHGCDSAVTLHLTIHDAVTNQFAETACDNYTWNGQTYTTSGDYVQYFQTVHGCDSAVTLHLTIHNAVTNQFAETACDIYTWNGQNYIQSGDYVQHFQTVHGCDSAVTLHLTIHNAVTHQFSETACDTFTWNGQTYTTSGDYVQHFQTVHGCDSTVTVHLTISDFSATEYAVTTCDSLVWNGQTYIQSGDHTQTFTATDGCDSIVTLHLTVVPAPTLSHTPDTVIINGTSANLWASGAGILYWTDANDSILSSGNVLTVNPASSTTYYLTGQNNTAAVGDNLVVNGGFEAGNVMFVTDYQYITGYNNMYFGRYSITSDGILIWGNDHLYGYGGTGQFMVVDGATSPNSVIWQQTVPVTPNTYYAFSAQVASTLNSNTSNSYALFQFSVNGTQLGDIFHSPDVLNVWQPYYEVWYSGNNTSATLSILNQNTDGNGNDFGLDDIVFAPLSNCSVTDTIHVVVIGYPDNVDSADCTFMPEGTEWGIAQPLISSAGAITVSTPMVGDIDDDGQQEIVIPAGNSSISSTINIFNADATLKSHFNTVGFYIWNSIGLAKVKWQGNEYKNIIVLFGTDKRLHAYDAQGTHLWQSDQPFSSHNGESSLMPAISFADFNHDGWSEVYIGGEVFDAATGVLLCKTNGNKGGANRTWSWSNTPYQTMAADLCGDSKLELAVGNTVYDVDIQSRTDFNTNRMTIARQLPSSVMTMEDNSQIPFADGNTFLADINLDGALDVVVMNEDGNRRVIYLYAWDVETNTIICSKKITNARKYGTPQIGDLDNNGYPEICFITGTYSDHGTGNNDMINALKYNPSNSNGAMDVFWSIPHEDNSGSTGLTMFDFNQDGYVELVYRDCNNLRIINGSLYNHQTGQPVSQPYNLAEISCHSATGVEYPVVADVDLDGEAEIVIGGATTPTDYGHLYIFKSSGEPWAPARKVWNQYMYNVTNVNEDLTVPQYLFNNATAFTDPNGVVRRPFNNFLQQATTIDQYGRPFYAVPDVAVNQASIQTAGDSVSVTVSYCNLGDNTLNAPYPVTIFANAYGGDTVCTVMMSENLPVDSCTQGVIQLPASALCGFHGLDSLVVAVNGNNIGIAQNGSLQPECDTTNNTMAVPITMHIDTTHLTATACDSYLWYGDTLTQSGEYMHTLTNAAGCDSVEVMNLTITPVPTLSHTPDTVIINGTSATLWASGADILYWTDDNNNLLSSGNSLTVSPYTTTTYYVNGQNYAAAGDNLVVNGDFEEGNVGFNSDYVYGAINVLFGSYDITTDVSLFWGTNHLFGYGGSGQFMLVDGATTPNSIVWQQTVSVTPNTYYAFSAQVASTWYSNNADSYALLQFSVNNTQLGDIFHSPDVLNVWQPYYEVWYSGSNTTATLSILNQNTDGNGNDFGLDDIVFAPLTNCSVTDTIHVVVSGYPDNVDSADCTFMPEGTEWGIAQPLISSASALTVTTPLVGDIDDDGQHEILIPDGYYKMNVFRADGTLKTQFSIAGMPGGRAIGTIGLAKVQWQQNQYKTIIVVFGTNKRLYAYDANGNQLWQTAQPFSSYNGEQYPLPTISFADFNHDGWTEVYVGGEIYDAATGVLLGKATGNKGYAGRTWDSQANPYQTIAADLYGDYTLEMAVGNTVYAVDIQSRTDASLNQVSAIRQIPSSLMVMEDNAAIPFTDGNTSLVDINNDGRLDVLVMNVDQSNRVVYCYVWDVETQTIICSKKIPNARKFGCPQMGDLDNDGSAEICFLTGTYSGHSTGNNDLIYALKYNELNQNGEMDVFWTVPHGDNSACTGLTLFDFNQDGYAELVYRDISQLRILNGSLHHHQTGETVTQPYDMASFPCSSNTQIEYPIVADVDLDGEAEIIVSGATGMTDYGHLYIFKSSGEPWAPARKVWNQYMYNVTNVNEDLTIPQYLFNNATAFTDPNGVVRRPFNNFLQQATTIDQYGRPFYAVPDVAVNQASVQTVGDSVSVTVSYCNLGDNTFNAPYPVTVFANAYGGDTVCTVMMQESLPVDSCTQGVIQLPASALCGFHGLDSLVVVVNGNNVGIAQNGSLQPECDTTNNTVTVPITMHADTTHLTATACDSYLWYGDTLMQSGTYTHTLANVTGCDSVEVLHLTIIPLPVLTHTPDTVIINGTSANLWASGAGILYWTDANDSILSSGNVLTVSPESTTTYYLHANNSSDTISCSINDSIRVVVSGYPDNVMDVDCVFPPDSNAFEMVELFQYPNVNSMSTPMVADMDGDGLPEIIACTYTYSAPWYSTGFHVVNGQTGALKYDISTVQYRNAGQMMTIADVDHDGKSELFLLGRDMKLYCYNYNGGVRWSSANTVDKNYLLSAADVNNDGEAEIVCGKYIYNAQTGTLLLEGTMVETGMGFGAPHSVDSYHPPYYMYALGDVDNDGTSELCAGNTVYKMQITNPSGTTGNSWSILRQAFLPDSIVNKDGETFIVDFDNDGDFDVCVIGITHSLNNYTSSHMLNVYVWDGQTSELIAHSPLLVNGEWGASIPYSGDLDGDGFPEIIFAVTNIGMLAYTYDTTTSSMSLMHNHSPFGETSGFTVFDFNQDGRSEIVYRGTHQLYIVDGITLNNLNEPITAYSGTVTEYPVVADVNADGHAEIVVTRAYGDWFTGSNANGWVSVYGSQIPGAWSSARKVWNQWAYNSVNINEDMTVPQHQFDISTTFPNGKKPFNSFLRQMPYIDSQGDLFNAVADIMVSSANIAVQNDTVTLLLTCCNIGDNTLFAPYPVTIFANAYGGDTVCTVMMPENLPVDSCTQGVIQLPASALCGFHGLDSLVIVVNGNNIGIAQNGSLQPECDTTNNTAAVPITMHADTAHMTVTACDSYLWYGDTLTQSGMYSHTLANVTGCDSIVVMSLQVNPSPTAMISGLAVLCADSVVTLTADSAFSYLWCTGDTTRSISVAEAGVYSLTVTNEYGCSAEANHQLVSVNTPTLSVTVPDMCAGGSYTLSVGYQPENNIHLEHGETTLSMADTIFLPDGIYCAPFGCSYRSPLTFTAYAPGDTIQSVEDIYYVKLNIEHSWIGDLYINITCPNGQKADLLKYGGIGTSDCNVQIVQSSRGWAAGNNMDYGNFLGEALDFDGFTCDASEPGNEPGVGWNYCWSENTTQGYTYAPGVGSLIYRIENEHYGIVDSSNVTAGTNFYRPDDSFSNLIGCPLNGDWYIEVQDGWSIDNGYIFGWELALSTDALPDVEYEFDYSTADGPWLTTLSDSLFQITPPADLEHDTVIAYTFTMYDTIGCGYDTTVYINVYAVRHTEVDTAVCESFTWNDSVYTVSGQYVQIFTSAVGCDSIVTLTLQVNPYPTAVISGLTTLCADSVVTLTADSAFSYLWCTGDTTRSISVAEAGVYSLTVSNEYGCSAEASHLLVSVNTPTLSVTAPDMCAGGSYTLSVGYQPENNIQLAHGETTLSMADTIFLPDGIDCAPFGCSYRSPLTFSAYAPGDTIQSVEDIYYVRLNIEHSWIGDLYINITCPNGQKADLLKYSGSGSSSCNSQIPLSSRGWTSGANMSVSVNFGDAYSYSISSCDALTSGNEPGVGWNYCWSENTTQGYTYAPGVGSLIYRNENAHNGSVDSSNVTAGTHFYHPDDSFSNLIGCPLNGDWYIEVQDGWGGDNGYIFGWELALSTDALPDVEYEFDYSTADGPWLTTLSDTLFQIIPPANLEHDTVIAYTFTMYDTIGCGYDTTVYINVYAIRHTEIDTAVCESFTWNDSIYTVSGQYVQIFTSAVGCDSTVTLTLQVNPYPTAVISGLTTLCADSVVTLTADSAFSYLWCTGDTTRSISVAEAGVYSLTVSNEYGCSAEASHLLASVNTPTLSVTVPDMCAGSSYTLSVGYQPENSIHLEHGETTLSMADTIFLPDGIYCAPYGCSYRSPLTFTAYAPGDTIQSVEDIYYVRLNMEHSFLGDLYINITCPNGQKADLMKYGGSGSSSCSTQIPSSSRGWVSGNNMSVGTYLGVANYSSTSSCDASAYGNEPGVGWNYCWSENTTQGYSYAPGLGSLIYRSDNAHNGIVDSSNAAAGTHFYHPDDSFSNLIGCPLNGDWYIEVQDGWSGDNGYIFGWELSLSADALPDMEYEFSHSTADGPWLTTLADSLFRVDPPASLERDTVIAYTFTLYDTIGCGYDTTVYVNVYAVRHAELDTAVCESFVWNDSVYTVSGQYVQTFTSAVGCDSIVTLTLQISPYPTAVISGLAVLCEDSVVMLTADSAYSYLWSTGDTTRSISVAEEGIYTLIVTNEIGCTASASHQIFTIDNPILSVTVPDMCAGGSYTLSVGYQSENNIHLGQGETTLSLTDTIFLPDGIYCAPFGCSYRSPLTFTAYAPDDTIRSVEDIYYVRLNMEHSFIGDLYINITCPNGQKADLLKYGGSGSSDCSSQIPASSRGWASGYNMSGGTFFGDANTFSTFSCDASAYGNEPGVGWNYCWSENTTQGYTYAPGTGSLIYRSQNAHHGIVDSSDVASGTHFYHPDDSFSNLIGCPLNGDWYIEVQDGWSVDNGYIFGWELSLNADALPDMDFELDYSTADGPWLTILSDSLFQITPPAGLEHDTVIAYTFTVYDTTGCGFDTTVYVNVYATRYAEVNASACDNFTWNDSIYTVSGQYVQTFTSAVGCDSIVTLHLTINHETHGDTTAVACGSFTWHGVTYTTTPAVAPTYTIHGGNHSGCDSVVTLHLTVNHETNGDTTAVVCESFAWHGVTYTTTPAVAPTYTISGGNHDGCDSIVTLHLTVNHKTYGDTTAVACGSFTWHGVTYTTTPAVAPTYTIAGGNHNGCDSIVTLHLTVNQGTHEVSEVTACESYEWHGTTYTTSGTYTYAYTDANGCSSVDTLHLTMHYGTHNVFDTTVCQSYEWHGETYTATDTYVHLYTNADDCPSADTLHLTISSGYEYNFEEVICEGDAYNNHGFVVSSDQTIGVSNMNLTQNLQSQHGCDSILNVSLTIIDTAVQIIPLTADFCDNMSMELSVVTPMADYVWSTGENSSTITVSAPGLYSVTASEGGCSATAGYVVNNCEFMMVLPNAITPSVLDGVNDYFELPEVYQNQMYHFTITIYNRWGGVVFTSRDKSFRWNGEVNGEIPTNVLYNYIIQYKDRIGSNFLLKGSLLVL